MRTQHISCPACGHDFTASADATWVVCPKCGHTDEAWSEDTTTEAPGVAPLLPAATRETSPPVPADAPSPGPAGEEPARLARIALRKVAKGTVTPPPITVEQPRPPSGSKAVDPGSLDTLFTEEELSEGPLFRDGADPETLIHTHAGEGALDHAEASLILPPLEPMDLEPAGDDLLELERNGTPEASAPDLPPLPRRLDLPDPRRRPSTSVSIAQPIPELRSHELRPPSPAAALQHVPPVELELEGDSMPQPARHANTISASVAPSGSATLVREPPPRSAFVPGPPRRPSMSQGVRPLPDLGDVLPSGKEGIRVVIPDAPVEERAQAARRRASDGIPVLSTAPSLATPGPQRNPTGSTATLGADPVRQTRLLWFVVVGGAVALAAVGTALLVLLK